MACTCLAMPDLPWLDDAYITLHSATSVVASTDTIYQTSPLTGVTSPVFLAPLVGLILLGLEPLHAVRVMSAGSVVALACTLWSLGRAVGIAAVSRALFVASALACGQVIAQTTNGLETAWALAAVVWMLSAAIEGRTSTVSVLAGLMLWLRPELVITAAAVFIWTAVRATLRQRLAMSAYALVAAVPFAIWVHSATGDWVTGTMSAKRAWFAEGCLPWPVRSVFEGVPLLLWLTDVGLFVCGAAVFLRTSLGRVGCVAILVTLAIFFGTFPGALSHNERRYLYPLILPWLAWGWARWFVAPETFTRVFVTVGSVVTIGAMPLLRRDYRPVALEARTAAEWIRTNTPPKAIVLTHDAGVFSVFSDRRLVDLVGLKSPSSAAVHRAVTWPSCGRDRGVAMTRIADSSDAGFLVVTAAWDRIYRIGESLRASGYQLTVLRDAPPLDPAYRIYKLQRR
jgi:hypothetical protein